MPSVDGTRGAGKVWIAYGFMVDNELFNRHRPIAKDMLDLRSAVKELTFVLFGFCFVVFFFFKYNPAYYQLRLPCFSNEASPG